MNARALRPWMLGMALGCFAAGVVTAWVGGELLASTRAAAGLDDDYLQNLTTRFGLTAGQQRSLRLVLQNERESEYTILSSTEWAQLPPPILARLLVVRDQTKKRIRMVLDERQRDLFDRLSEWPRGKRD